MDQETALLVLGLLLSLIGMALKFYGIVLSFKKKWYMGAVALLVPFFGEIVAISKLIFKKDILE